MKRFFGILAVIISVSPVLRGQWQQTNFPKHTVIINSFAGHAGYLFAHTKDDGTLVSHDNGGTWSDINEPAAGEFTAIIDAGYNVVGGTGAGIFVSTDAGMTWAQVSDGALAIREFAMTSTSIFAATSSGVYGSTDGGLNWTEMNSGIPAEERKMQAITAEGQNIYAAAYVGAPDQTHVYRSTDGGNSWSAIMAGTPHEAILAGDLLAAGGYLFAGSLSRGVQRTTDGSASWVMVDSEMTKVRALVTSGNALLAATYGGGVYRSTDFGASWTPTNSGLSDLKVFDLNVNGGNIVAATAPGSATDPYRLYRSSDYGMSWTAIPDVMSQTAVTALMTTQAVLFAGSDQGIEYSTDRGNSWTHSNTGSASANIYSFARSGPKLFAGSYGGGVLRTDDNGANWVSVNNGLTDQHIYSLAVSGENLFAVGDASGVFRSTNNGDNWEFMDEGFPITYVYSVAANGPNVFAGTSDQGMVRSTDNGNTWARSNTGMPATNSVYSLLAWNNSLYAATDSGLFKSTDNGTNWGRADLGLEGSPYTLADNGQALFAGTFDNGVSGSTDLGNDWTALNQGLSERNIYSLAATSDGQFLYAGTESGVWSNWLANTDVDEHSVAIGTAGICVSPNPVSESAVVHYSLDSRSTISISIHDALGRVIDSPVENDSQPSGEHTLRLSTTGLEAGIYFVRVQIGGREKVARMLIVK